MYAAIHIPNATPQASVQLAEIAKTFSPLIELTAHDTIGPSDRTAAVHPGRAE